MTNDALRAQALADGPLGTALLLAELRGRDRWMLSEAHAVLAHCTRDLLVTETASLYLGAPAVAFALRAAGGRSGRYTCALRAIDRHIDRLIGIRLSNAHARIDRADTPEVGEFDLFYGLTGLGAYLLHRGSDHTLLREILAYLVRLTQPIGELPGWWTHLDPERRQSPDFSGGHGNLGMAHGVAGVLSLLAICTLHQIVVPGQRAALEQVSAWLRSWRQDSTSGPWWPGWITLDEHRTGSLTQNGPQRPSWCYGTPGTTRALQLAAIALDDTGLRHDAENAALACVTDTRQLDLITEPGICHGTAGLLHTTTAIAHDAEPDRSRALTAAIGNAHDYLATIPDPAETGFLHGTSGRDLALLALETADTATGWDTCLLSGRHQTGTEPAR